MHKRPGRKSAAQTPAPKSDRIYGSSKNAEKSASSESSASSISLSSKIIKALENKLKKFKETHDTKKVSLRDLKAVYRRGLGAYSNTHRPTITGGVPNSRNAWAMARVNKFLLKAGGTKVKAAYVQDDDLMKYDGGGEIPNDLRELSYYKGAYKGAELYSMGDDKEYEKMADRWYDLMLKHQGGKKLNKKEFEEFKKLSSTLYQSDEYKEGGKVWNDKELLKKYNSGESIGFTGIAHLKAQGLIKRADGTKRKSMEEGGEMNKNMIQLPDVQSSEESLKRVLGMQGYKLEKGGQEIFDNRTFYDSDPIGTFYKKGGQTESEKELQEIYKIQKMQELQKTMEDGGVMAKGGKTKVKAKGDCYVAAGDIVMDYLLSQRGFGAYLSEFKFNGTPYLVHAEAAGQGHLEGVRYGHAWIEDDNLVYDYSNGRKIVFPKQLYYSIGDVDEDNPMKYQKYTFEEANNMMMKTGNYGCWDIDVEFADGGSVIGDRKIKDVRKVNTEFETKVYGTYEDGYEEVIFDYFPDEIEFSDTELIGLTAEEANELKDEKQQYYAMHSNTSAFKHGGSLNDNEVICVNCSCEWDKAHSDKDYMYNCHKCGFDNTFFYTVFKETMTLEEIAEKHGVDMEYLQAQFEEGTKHEIEEHTKGGTNLSREVGETIALHHLEETPEYYEKIKLIQAYKNGGDISSKEQYLDLLLTEAFDLLDSHVNNGGLLDYSQDEYGYLNDEVEDVQVGYFKDEELDSTYAEQLREEGFTMDLQEAIDTLEHRLSSIDEEMKELFGKEYSTRWDDFKKINNKNEDYENGGEVRKFYKTGKWKYILINKKRKNDFQKWSNKRETLEKELEFFRNQNPELASEMEIYETEVNDKIRTGESISMGNKTFDESFSAFELKEKMADGGKAKDDCGCSGNYIFAQGGVAYGNSHDKGGIPMKVGNSGPNIEIEGGEGVINKRSMQMTKKFEFEGNMMTPCQIISKINEMGGGVKFQCSDVKEIIEKDGGYVFAQGGLAYGNSHDKGGMPIKVVSTGQNIEIEGGEGVINKRSMQMRKKVKFEGEMMTPCEVISKINEMGGGVKFDCSDVKEIIEKDGDF